MMRCDDCFEVIAVRIVDCVGYGNGYDYMITKAWEGWDGVADL